ATRREFGSNPTPRRRGHQPHPHRHPLRSLRESPPPSSRDRRSLPPPTPLRPAVRSWPCARNRLSPHLVLKSRHHPKNLLPSLARSRTLASPRNQKAKDPRVHQLA